MCAQNAQHLRRSLISKMFFVQTNIHTFQYPTLHKPPPIPDDVAAKMPATSNAPPYICELPSVCGTVDPAARDLLGRLLHIDPQQRLRSMYALERIAMYKGYAIADVRARKVSGERNCA